MLEGMMMSPVKFGLLENAPLSKVFKLFGKDSLPVNVLQLNAPAPILSRFDGKVKFPVK